MEQSNCCGAGNWLESGICEQCKEHAEFSDWEEEDCYREIMYICYNRTMMTYYETMLQFKENVLESDKFLNDNILGKFYKTKIQKYIDDEQNKHSG